MSEIQNELAREFLLTARNYMQQEKYLDVIAYATASLEVVLTDAKHEGFQSSVDLNEIILCYYLGIDIEPYVRYRKMAGYWAPNASGSVPYQTLGLFSSQVKLEFDKQDAEVSLDYCTKTITSIEETLERFNKPLSEE
jgi:hypothetical protein